MPPHLLRKIAIVVVAVVALGLAFATLAYEGVRRQIAAAVWVDHTERVELAIDAVVIDFGDAESGLRGYRLTGDAMYEEAFAAAIRRVPSDLQEVRVLTQDNGNQQIRARSLADLATDELAALRWMMTLPAPAAPGESLASRMALDAKNMNRLRDVTDVMKNEEERLLAMRRDQLETARGVTQGFTGLGIMASFMVLCGAVLGVRRQVHEAEATSKLLADSELRFRLLAETASDLVRIHDPAGVATYVSPSAERLLGYTSKEMRALPAYALMPPEDRESVRAHVARLAETGEQGASVRHRLRKKTGETRWFETLMQPVIEGGKVVRFHTASRDIDDQVSVTGELARSRELYRTLVKHLPDTAVLLFDGDLRYVLVEGDRVLSHFDLSKATCEGKTLSEMTTPERAARILPAYRAALAGEETEFEIDRGDRNFALQCVPVRDGTDTVVGGLAVVHDVTDLRGKERQLAEQADELRAMSLIDELTKLYNRRGFLALATQQLKISLRNKTSLSVVFCDLDGMKKINDGLGHERGDEALVDTAEILRKTFRESDIVARLGGDEFVVLATDAPEKAGERIVTRLNAEIAAHAARAERPFRVSISTGVATFDPEDPLSIEELLKEADSRMYDNKRSRTGVSRDLRRN